MTRKLINDIRENLEAELLKSLNNKNKQTPVTVQKVPVSSRFLDTQRQEDVLYKMLQHYRLFDLKYEVSDFIKSISRYEPDYYTVKITSDFIDRIITKFKEKEPNISGYINAGLYLCDKIFLEKILENLFQSKAFSFEKDFLEKKITPISTFISDGYFIDIGIEEDFLRAQTELKR